jgi:hypothetical protein
VKVLDINDPNLETLGLPFGAWLSGVLHHRYYDDLTWFFAKGEITQALKDFLYTSFKFIGFSASVIESEIDGYLSFLQQNNFAC